MTATPTPGLFGKLPAHGDFVRRGWPDATVRALDAWLSTGTALLRDADPAGFEARFAAAPMWRGYVPPGMLGDDALYLALAPSIDRAGRFFPVACGMAGTAEAAWRHAGAGVALDALLHEAIAGRQDADALAAALGALAMPAAILGAPPAESRWWRSRDDATIATTRPDAAFLASSLFATGDG